MILSKDGERKHLRVHRLVAEAYIPNPENKPFVNHKDEIKNHNWLNNLEWATAEENMNYGTCQEKKKQGYNTAPVICVELNKAYSSVMKAERELSIHHQSIYNCLHGKQKTAGGYHWKRAEEA